MLVGNEGEEGKIAYVPESPWKSQTLSWQTLATSLSIQLFFFFSLSLSREREQNLVDVSDIFYFFFLLGPWTRAGRGKGEGEGGGGSVFIEKSRGGVFQDGRGRGAGRVSAENWRNLGGGGAKYFFRVRNVHQEKGGFVKGQFRRMCPRSGFGGPCVLMLALELWINSCDFLDKVGQGRV